MTIPIRHLLSTGVLIGALALSGCATGAAPDQDTASGASQPVSETNCGRTLSFDAPPRRIVSLWPAITEMLISLGAEKSVIGQAFTSQSEPLPNYADAFHSIPTLASDAVGREALLAARPDLVIADGEYHFDGTELPTIADLNALGVQVYIISSFCNGRVTTGHVVDAQADLASLGRILGSGEKATRLIDAQKKTLATVAEQVTGTSPVPLVLIQFFDGALYADARGLYSDVVAKAGGRNLYDDDLPADQYYAQISVEDFVKKDPGTIVYLYNSEEDKDTQLQAITSQLANVSAVRNGRVFPLPSASFIGSRAVDGVEGLHELLHG